MSAAERPGELVKEYDFRALQDLSEFTTEYIWPRAEIINDEHQFYLDTATVPAQHDPFFLSGTGLSIVASPTHPDLADIAVGLTGEGRRLVDENRNKGMPNPLTPDIIEAHGTRQPFTSGLLTTRDHGHSQLYGYWEASMRLPKAKGAWPAFWLLPTFKQWPAGIAVLPEIDIMEAVEDVNQGIYHSTIHTNESGMLTSTTDNAVKTGQDLTNEYHTYGLSWERDMIITYFDGQEVLRRRTPRDMHEPRHFLLNLAVGGWGGEPDPADYPASLDIEYVRIYSSTAAAQPDDIVHTLRDGRVVRKSDINLVTEYLIELNELPLP